MEKSDRSIVVAGQLVALLRRHCLTVSQLSDRLNERPSHERRKMPVSIATLYRIKNGEFSSPKAETLGAIATVVGEDYLEAFSDKPAQAIEIDGRKYLVVSLDGKPIAETVLRRLAGLQSSNASVKRATILRLKSVSSTE